MMFIHLVIIQCVKVVISPYLNDGKVKYLTHGLRLATSTLQNSKVFWDLETNDLRYRIRQGKFYLDLDKENKLTKRDGGKAMEDFDELQRLNELKNLFTDNSVEKVEKASEAAPKKRYEDPIVEKKKNKLLSSLVYLLSPGSNSNMSSGLVEPREVKESNLIGESAFEKKNTIESNFVENATEKKDNITTSNFLDPISQAYFTDLGDKSNVSYLTGNDSTVESKKPVENKNVAPTKEANKEKSDSKLTETKDKAGKHKKKSNKAKKESKLAKEKTESKKNTNELPQQASNLSEEIKPIKKNISELQMETYLTEVPTENTERPEPERNSTLMKSELKEELNNEGIELQKNLLSSSAFPQNTAFPANSSNQPPQPVNNAPDISSKGPVQGFDFELIPIFVHKLEKKTIIMRNKLCLTHDLSFKPCKFVDFWSLGHEFYWDIYRAEDTAYLKKLQSIINLKTNSNDQLKANQYAVTKNCPNPCPAGNCESSDTETGESFSTADAPMPQQQMKPTFQNLPNTNYVDNRAPVNYASFQPQQPTVAQPMYGAAFNPMVNMIRRTIPVNTMPAPMPVPVPAPMPMPVAVQQPKEKVLVDKDLLAQLLNQNGNR